MKGMECIKCGKIAKEAKLDFNGYKIDGWICECREEYYDPVQSQRILALNKLRGKIYNLRLGKLRNSLILRLPKEIEDAIGFKERSNVKVSVGDKDELQIAVG